ncbi:MAG: adenylate/guanylate cyclase domain-containing protein, partial [Acidimicrobiales bacterium]
MADGLPSGTVTFLFTDVVDSTLLWETSPEEMRATIAGLDDLTRETIGAHEGKLVKSVGDGAMAVFQDAERAVAAAVDLQRQLDNPGFPVPVKVRIGLHTGQATPVDGDYLAPAVNRAARIAGAAHGGQILVSDVTATLVERTSTLDLGDHHLKGLEPQRLHQVIAAGLPADFPALATAIVAGVALPSPPTSFIGRADDVSAVAELLREHPLVTLTGTPGSGKTRLAIAIAQPIAEHFPDGVVFADLATVTDERGVTATVAQALGLAAELTDDPVARISAYLAQRSTLCILDNCEHVIDATAHLARRVVEVPGRSRLLATSREPIGVLGEQVYRVASLDLETEAVQLFVERAREAKASFRLDEDSKHQVLELCRRLDGIPLAIELAAARVTHLAPAQLVDLLDDRLRVLAGGRGRIQRHQTLMATLDWSYDLLSAPEQRLLQRLAVFPASFSLEAAEALGERDALEPLAALVDKS